MVSNGWKPLCLSRHNAGSGVGSGNSVCAWTRWRWMNDTSCIGAPNITRIPHLLTAQQLSAFRSQAIRAAMGPIRAQTPCPADPHSQVTAGSHPVGSANRRRGEKSHLCSELPWQRQLLDRRESYWDVFADEALRVYGAGQRRSIITRSSSAMSFPSPTQASFMRMWVVAGMSKVNRFIGTFGIGAGFGA